MSGGEMDADDLRESVREFRDPSTDARARDYIVRMWKTLGIPNQFAAMVRAREMEQSLDA